MDLQTIQALGVLINQIGLPATVGVLLVIITWNLMPVVAEYLRSKIVESHAHTQSMRDVTNGSQPPSQK